MLKYTEQRGVGMKVTPLQRLKYMNMFRKYLKEYGQNYSDTFREFIQENFLKLTEPGETPDILFQLYCKFGMIPEEQNIYMGFAKMIGEKYGWNNRILEVGGGYYPIFSKYVDDEQQKSGSGTITVMDPVLVTDKLGKVKLQKQEFSRDMDVSDFELLIGICPCEATKEIISSALFNKKEFFIALCGCTPSQSYAMPCFGGYDFVYRMWVNAVYSLAKKQEEDGFEVVKQHVDNFPYPIISSKRKK